jgi:hypothetical protein
MSVHEHLSDDVLIDALYGLADARLDIDINSRVRECPACASRWSALQEQRVAIAASVEPAADFLAAQRRNIYRRIEQPSAWQHASRWAAPAMAAAACVLAVGLFVRGPFSPQGRPSITEVPTAPPAAISDTQLYSDVYSMEQSFEPSTAASLSALFEPDESKGANQAADPGARPALEQ